MNEFGEPNMGNPSVRFDEGRNGNVVLTTMVCSNRLFPTPPTLLKKFLKKLDNRRLPPARNRWLLTPGSVSISVLGHW